MSQLSFTEEELFAEHEFSQPHRVAGQLCHGGFDADGAYLPPRSLVRPGAINAWADALASRGGGLLAADASLLAGTRYPSTAQQKLLLQSGLGQTFWNSLTITGKIEARGRILADMTFPEFQEVICEDISETGLGHMHKGLLRAHGLDEGGQPERGIGGHDVMWFALRDLAFGAVDYPDAEPPERIGRPESPRRLLPDLPSGHEQTLLLLMNLLIIEFRAELAFRFVEELLRDPELFTTRRVQAEEAAEVVGRIRKDEEIHVGSLRLFLGEFRQLSVKTSDGGQRPGSELLDPIWNEMVEWATVEQPKLQAEQQREILSARILEHPDGARILDEFEARS